MIEKRLQAVEARLQNGDVAINQIKKDLAENTEATRRIDANTREMVEFFESMRGAFKVLNWIGALARPIGAVVMLGTGLWAAWVAYRTGVPR